MTDIRFRTTARPSTPIYQTLSRAGTRELITIHVDEHQAAGNTCILCNRRDVTHPDSVAYGRLLGATTDLIACGACVKMWTDGLPQAISTMTAVAASAQDGPSPADLERSADNRTAPHSDDGASTAGATAVHRISPAQPGRSSEPPYPRDLTSISGPHDGIRGTARSA